MLFAEPEEAEPEEEQAESALGLMMLLETFKTGDEETFVLLFGSNIDAEDLHPLEAEYYDKLITQRDKGMAAEIAKLLENGDDGGYFIIVGAGHLVGDNSVVKLLEDMGYTVERIK
jgi:hypothetical protein